MAHHPDDRPDPNENMPAMRARVPEHVNRGVFCTGAIVMTGGTEFVIDFVQNLGRPHQIVARVVIPHVVMPQFADALAKNIDLYKQRFGPLPNPIIPGQPQTHPIDSPPAIPPQAANPALLGTESQLVGGFAPALDGAPTSNAGNQDAARSHPIDDAPSAPATGGGAPTTNANPASPPPGSPPVPPSVPTPSVPPPRKPTAQEVYDDLKLRDELLSGTYANAVMIGHGPHEFSFDFITNFYPQSAVSSRVFLAAGQVARLLDSLRSAWDQLRPRL